MTVKLSDHALQQIKKRDLSEELVSEELMESPS